MSEMNKCIIIPDSFKGTLSAIEVCNIMKQCVAKHFPSCNVITIPVADGGEGTVECFLYALNYEKVIVQTTNPFGEPISAYYGKHNETAIMEVASVAGLPQAEGRLNPCIATTLGLGALIKDALQCGCREIIIGLGGSCTNDGGIGVASALGTKFYNQSGQQFLPTADHMTQISHIDISATKDLLKNCSITAMCDITNPMFGLQGAAHVYAPQKGADKSLVALLDYNLQSLAKVISHSISIDVSAIPGSGAAGALGAGIVAFLGGRLKSGIETILDLISFDDMLPDTDMIFTGEGRIDSQSLSGKVIAGVARHAKAFHIPVTVVAGAVEEEASGAYDLGVSSMFSINRKAVDYETSKDYSDKSLEQTMDSILRFYKVVAK